MMSVLLTVAVWQTTPTPSGFKQDPFYCILRFCGSGIWAGLGWVLVEVTWRYSAGGWAGLGNPSMASLVSGPGIGMARGLGLAETGHPAVPLATKLVPVLPWDLCTLCSPAWNTVPPEPCMIAPARHSFGSGPRSLLEYLAQIRSPRPPLSVFISSIVSFSTFYSLK